MIGYTRKWMRKMGCGVLIACLCLCVCFCACAASGTGITTKSDVFLRKEASSSADYWFRLPLDYVCNYSDTLVDKDGMVWYRVTISDPNVPDTTVRTGYIRGDCYASTNVTSQTSGNVDVSGNSATGVLSNSDVNMRTGPGFNYDTVFKGLQAGTYVELLSIPAATDPDPWYKVRYDGREGYIQGPFIRVISYGSLSTDTSGNTAVQTATATPAPQGPGTTATTQPSSPSGTTSAVSGDYVRLILSSAHLRERPAGKVWEDWEERGATLPLAGSSVTQDGYTWYPVTYKGRVLYVRGDCVEVSYSGVVQATTAPTAAPAVGFVRTIVSDVNFRLQPGGTVIRTIPKNQVLAYLTAPTTSGKYTWYYVEYEGSHGYVRSDCVELYGSTATAAPTATAQTSAGSYGYIRVTKSGVNVRNNPGGSRVTTVNINTVWPMTGNATTQDRYTWYPVSVNGILGYIRGDCAYKMSEAQVQEYLGGTSTPTTTSSTGYLQTVTDRVNLRRSPSSDGSSAAQVATGTLLTYTETAISSNDTWYHVSYNGQELWVVASMVRTLSESEYRALQQQATPTATAPTLAGYIRTTKSSVNVRATVGGSVIGRIDKGVVLGYTTKTTSKSYTWYLCTTSVGTGYLRSDCVTEVQADGSAAQPTAAPTAQITITTQVSTGQVEASYSTLREGSSGTAVSNMVQELINQGYYTGAVTSTYSSQITSAVRAFQTAKGLTANGVADTTTLNRLFGISAVGTLNYNDLSMIIYPAEKIDWYTGGIQELIPRGSNFKVYDVKTGIVWWAHRWAGGKHADIETLTAADTARLCQIYGVSKASEITSKSHWQRRPCLITVGTRTFACSLYGVPHNLDGDTIANNEMDGQVCLHFTNSRTHDSDKVDSYHTEAIQYAWEHAPNGNK